jgi:hypothetical protein
LADELTARSCAPRRIPADAIGEVKDQAQRAVDRCAGVVST